MPEDIDIKQFGLVSWVLNPDIVRGIRRAARQQGQAGEPDLDSLPVQEPPKISWVSDTVREWCTGQSETATQIFLAPRQRIAASVQHLTDVREGSADDDERIRQSEQDAELELRLVRDAELMESLELELARVLDQTVAHGNSLISVYFGELLQHHPYPASLDFHYDPPELSWEAGWLEFGQTEARKHLKRWEDWRQRRLDGEAK